MTDIESNFPHTAISTWSGFVYQGKVALFHCLKVISEEFNRVQYHKLQFESIDDFAVLDASDSCISMHQVKAYKDQNFSKYKSAIEKQKLESTKHPQASVYFHVSRSIRGVPSDFDINYSPVTFYSYDCGGEDKTFCALNEINDCVEELIKRIYIEHYPESTHKTNNDYLKLCRNCLENLTVEKVINTHHKIQESTDEDQRKIAFHEIIQFSEFFKILASEISEDLLNEDYFYQKLRKYTGIYFKEYCDEIDEDDNCDFKKLDCYMSHIISLDKKNLKKFICSILPDRKGSFCDLKSFKENTYRGDDLKYGLFYILDQLCASAIDSQGLHPSIFYWQAENNDFYPTAISQAEQLKKKVCKNIIKSAMSDDVDFLYESGTLITVGMNCDSIFDTAIGVGPFINYNFDENYHNKISRFKKIALISIDKAKRIIND